MAGNRGHFGTRLGFNLAAAGSAVGLGNIWKFPYLAGQNGGAVFLVFYLGFVFTIGLSVMLAEFAIGRTTQRNPVGAFKALKGGPWVAVGAMGVVTGFIILSFYSVVGGWTVAYAAKSATGLLATQDVKALGSAFVGFIGDPVEPVVYHGLFMVPTIAIVARGVDIGIERACRILMPLLFLLLVVLCVRSLTLPGAGAGIAFFLEPNFSKISAELVTAALGQAFFSLSLGMGAMITYGSYLSRQVNLPGAALWVTTLDSVIAVMAGFLILPAVFAFGFDPGAGPGLTFITLPAVFSQIPGGAFFGILFFMLLAVAALTSAISLIEVVVAYLVDERGIPRPRAAIGAGFVIFLLGIPSSLSLGVWSSFTVAGKSIFDIMDYLASNIMLPAGGVFIALFAGWVAFPRLLDGSQGGIGDDFRWAGVWQGICRYVAPVAIAVILISGL